MGNGFFKVSLLNLVCFLSSLGSYESADFVDGLYQILSMIVDFIFYWGLHLLQSSCFSKNVNF